MCFLNPYICFIISKILDVEFYLHFQIQRIAKAKSRILAITHKINTEWLVDHFIVFDNRPMQNEINHIISLCVKCILLLYFYNRHIPLSSLIRIRQFLFFSEFNFCTKFITVIVKGTDERYFYKDRNNYYIFVCTANEVMKKRIIQTSNDYHLTKHFCMNCINKDKMGGGNWYRHVNSCVDQGKTN
jgi:hypothetical protein